MPYDWPRVRKSTSPMTAAAASNSATGSTGVAFKTRLRTTPARRTTSVTTNTPRAPAGAKATEHHSELWVARRSAMPLPRCRGSFLRERSDGHPALTLSPPDVGARKCVIHRAEDL